MAPILVAAVLLSGTSPASAQDVPQLVRLEPSFRDEGVELLERELELLLQLADTDFEAQWLQIVAELTGVEDRGAQWLETVFGDADPPLVLATTLGPLPAAPTGLIAAPNPPQQLYRQAIAIVTSASLSAAGPPTPRGFGEQPILPTQAGAGPAALEPPSSGLESDLVLIVLGILMGVLAVAGFTFRRRDAERQQLVTEAMTDPLTGLANRRRLDLDISRRNLNGEKGVAVAMLDIDHFKDLNDRQGHVVGDTVLQVVAEVISKNVRVQDVVYRFGGEEFCVLLPDASEAEAIGVLERVLAHVSELDLSGIGESITISGGVSSDHELTIRSNLELADRALYSAKDQGRDRVMAFSQEA